MTILSKGLCFFVFVLIAATASAQDQDNRTQVGKITRVEGIGSASFQSQVRVLKLGAPVYFQDQLQTGPNSRLAVTLDDDSELTLGPTSSLNIDEFVYPSSMKLNLLNGALRFVGGKLEKEPNAKAIINTPVATLGIRGTEIIAETESHSIWVREGVVDATSKITGESITLQDDEATVFTSGPCLIMILPRAEKKRRLDYLSFSAN